MRNTFRTGKREEGRIHEKDLDISFAIIPSYSREGGFGIGGTATGLYRMDKNDSTMAPSNMAVSANAALNGFYAVAGNGINISLIK